MIAYPQIDPVIFSIGPIAIHWYGLMYVIGFAAGWLLARKRAGQPGSTWQPIDVDDLIFYAALGVIAGGRIGWILFYGFEEIMAAPLRALRIWEGGMSFHGGLLGVMVAVTWFAKRRGRSIGDVWDFTAVLPAIGLFTGRIGNFINGELWGKPTDVPWAVVFNGTPLHPSQLYEALLEGVVTFFILWTFTAKPRPRFSASGLFLLCYGVFRFAVEFVRVPDDNRGYLLWNWVTEGQLLSAPMIVAGAGLMIWAYRKNVASGNVKAVKREA
jgi:phosphatidylglycerol:prolipoprotein diacylglycerol transferase